MRIDHAVAKNYHRNPPTHILTHSRTSKNQFNEFEKWFCDTFGIETTENMIIECFEQQIYASKAIKEIYNY